MGEANGVTEVSIELESPSGEAGSEAASETVESAAEAVEAAAEAVEAAAEATEETVEESHSEPADEGAPAWYASMIAEQTRQTSVLNQIASRLENLSSQQSSLSPSPTMETIEHLTLEADSVTNPGSESEAEGTTVELPPEVTPTVGRRQPIFRRRR